MDALKHASNMICELRTSLLSPKNYYSLCKSYFFFTHIEIVSMYRHWNLWPLEKPGTISLIWQTWQKNGRALRIGSICRKHLASTVKKKQSLYQPFTPQLHNISYLLVTVGSAYIKLKEAPAKDVLKDIVEMCRGVQHPTRGLFLRTYLSEMTKDKMPDKGTPYEG